MSSSSNNTSSTSSSSATRVIAEAARAATASSAGHASAQGATAAVNDTFAASQANHVAQQNPAVSGPILAAPLASVGHARAALAPSGPGAPPSMGNVQAVGGAVPESIIDQLYCHLTGQFFRIAVMLLPGGHTVERAMAERLMADGQGYPTNSPEHMITGYAPNFAVQGIVDDYLQRNPAERDNQYPAYDAPAAVRAAPVQQDMPAAELSSARMPRIVVRRLPPRIEIDPEATRRIVRLPTAIGFVSGAGVPANGALKGFLFGDGDVGKTAFLHGGNPSPTMATIGVDIKRVTADNTTFTLQDTAGQERFRDLPAAYFNNAQFVLFFGTPEDVEYRTAQMEETPNNFEITGLTYVVDNGRLVPVPIPLDWQNLSDSRNQGAVSRDRVGEVSSYLLPDIMVLVKRLIVRHGA